MKIPCVSVLALTFTVSGCSGDTRPEPTGPPVPQAPPDIIVAGFAYVLRAVNDSPIQGSPYQFVVFATGTCEVGGVAGVDSIGIGPFGGFVFMGDIGVAWTLQR